ncbi:MAG: hypothetical protein M0Z84_09485 [Gammaproteobacteria bacterium]|nr:hypothetical protein [Gammaproteobacteria bacterium]
MKNHPIHRPRQIGRELQFVCVATIPVLLAAGWSASARASTVGNPDIAYVENALSGAPVALYPYGTLSASSVSPCFGSTCQNTLGNPFTTVSNSSSIVAGIGSAKSAADLSTGVLQAYAQEDGTTGSSAAAGAGFWDTLTFSGVTAGETATLNFSVSGSFTDVGFGGACAGYLVGLTAGSTCGSGSGSDPFGSGVTVLNASNPSETLSLSIPLANNTPTEIAFALGAAANNSFNIATADLYDPPHVTLTLNGPGSYTSASGKFLTSPVPLPRAAWLFASGLVGLLGIARRYTREQD